MNESLGQGLRLVTGATGFVGSHFVLRWLQQGDQVLSLARGGTPLGATERVERAVLAAANSLAAPPAVPKPQAVAADLTEPMCGLSMSALRSLQARGPSELWHFAASLQYEERHRAAIFEMNVNGTRRALELARALGCAWFVHVSTAYTSGRQHGSIPEQLPPRDVELNNCYEASKAEAEHLVAGFCAEHGLRYALLRPSVVIGPFCSKSTGGSSTGLYGFARELVRARPALSALGRPLRLQGDPATRLNLLPIDWFVDDVCELLQGDVGTSGIYHHTLHASPTIQQLGAVFAELLGLPGFTVAPSHPGPDSRLERLLARRTAFYAAYLAGDKTFERARPQRRQLSLEDVREYLAACVADSATSARYARPHPAAMG